MENHFDVVIIGAGPAGSAAAYHLASNGLRVALLDKSDFPRDKTCGDGLTPRAVKALEHLKALDKVRAKAYHCRTITMRHSDANTFRLSLAKLAGLPDEVLVLPRFSLDNIIREHAVEAGAHFFPNAKVENVTHEADGSVRILVEGREAFTGKLAIMATGANTALLKTAGIFRRPPRPTLAARCYFENVEGLDDTIMLFFDQVELPGYGWVFPTSPTSANIGCGVFFDSPTPQPTALRHIIQNHTYLKRILKNAKQVGPIKGYPLLTDFSPDHAGTEWALVVGESVGLVNPITGEGIDYALESAALAAEAIMAGWVVGRGPSESIGQNYRAALSKKYRYQLMLNHWASKLYFQPKRLDSLLTRMQHNPYLQQALVDACFGSADPMVLLSPRTLWEVFKP